MTESKNSFAYLPFGISLALGLVVIIFGTFQPPLEELSTDWLAVGIVIEETDRYKTELTGERSDGALIYRSTFYPIDEPKPVDEIRNTIEWDINSVPDSAVITDMSEIEEKKQWWEFWRWFE